MGIELFRALNIQLLEYVYIVLTVASVCCPAIRVVAALRSVLSAGAGAQHHAAARNSGQYQRYGDSASAG